MDKRALPFLFWLIAMAVFLYLGISQDKPTYLVLGVVFLILAIVYRRKSRTP